MRSIIQLLLVSTFISFVQEVIATCQAGHSTCRQLGGRGTWCKRDTNTCHGRPDIRCVCDHISDTSERIPPRGRHGRVSRASGSDSRRTTGIDAGASTASVPLEQRLPFGPTFVRRSRGSSATRRFEVSSTTVVRSAEPVASRHRVCKELSGSSWCKRDGTCHNFPQVRCDADTSAHTYLTLDRPTAQEPMDQITPPASIARPLVLWTEWPTLSPGEWPQYFDKLLGFIRANCIGVGVTRLVMRILNPEFQSERGLLWQITTESSFFKDFLQHLPTDVEVFFYPYLLDASDATRWAQYMRVHVPLEGAFKFTKKWNQLLARSGVSHQIMGIVVDMEDSGNFRDDLRLLASYKHRYSLPGQAELRFGIAIGFDMVGSISSLSPAVDDVFVEMYDFYVEGSQPAVIVEAHRNGALNNPARFLEILDHYVWSRYMRFYERYSSMITFMWSLQNKASPRCEYPLNDGTCGEKVDMGSWTAESFFNFLDMLKQRYPVFADTAHGIFQFNFLPREWQAC